MTTASMRPGQKCPGNRTRPVALGSPANASMRPGQKCPGNRALQETLLRQGTRASMRPGQKCPGNRREFSYLIAEAERLQ